MKITIYARKNRNDFQGKSEKHEIETNDIYKVNCWFNVHCNPTYNYFMSNGDNYVLLDDYGAMNDIDHLSRTLVDRKKDLWRL
jgi:hypothetical protein